MSGCLCCVQSGVQSSAVAALEYQLSWIESQLLPCLTVAVDGHARRPPRRLLVSTNCTLLSDPDTESPTQSQSVTMSDTSLVSPAHVSVDTRNFVTLLIKVDSLHASTVQVINTL